MWSGSRPIRCASCIQHRHKLHRLALISVTYQAILPPIKKQETLLSQMDARRALSVKMLSTVETSCTANPQIITLMELEGYS